MLEACQTIKTALRSHLDDVALILYHQSPLPLFTSPSFQ